MQFTRLRLKNYKCYESLDVELSQGVTVVHGVNGSGKSSLLNACFFGLYGTDALEPQQTLESIITKDKESTEVELWFEHAGYQYQLQREIRQSGSQIHHSSKLNTPNKQLEGVTETEQEIQQLLRMDADAFLNCAFVRQGDITRLLTASPTERQRMIDELLQLGKLDLYQERMNNARVGVDRVRRAQETRLGSLQDEINDLEAEDLPTELDSLSDEINEIESRRNTIEEKRDEVEEELRDIESQQEEISEFQTELTETEQELDEKQESLEETRERLDSLDAEIEELNNERNRIEEKIQSLVESASIELSEPMSVEEAANCTTEITTAIDSVSERLESKTEDITELRENAQAAAATSRQVANQLQEILEQATEEESRAEELVAEATEKQEQIESREEKLAEKQERIEEKKAAFDDSEIPELVGYGDANNYLESVSDRLSDLEEKDRKIDSEYTRVCDRVEHAEKLLAAGKCPECGQSVDEAPEVESVETDRETADRLARELEDVEKSITRVEDEQERAEALVEIESEIQQLESECESIRALLAEQKSSIENLHESAEKLRGSVAEKREKHEALREKKAQKEQTRDSFISSIERLSEEKSSLETEKDELERLLDTIRNGEQVVSRIDEKQSRREDITALHAEQESQLMELTEEVRELQEAVDSAQIEELKAQYEKLESKHSGFTDRLEELSTDLEELTEERGRVHSAIQRLEKKQEEADEAEEKLDAVENVVRECEELEMFYGELQTDLRQRNITQLEQLVNDIFSLVYQNDSYSRIELTGEYELAIYEKTGESLEPTELSGGEKALFNLSLRCAIYQLLAEGIEGQAPLPPLILDEPTVHLDDEHVNRISELVDRMRQLGVDQTIVVSHEAEIVDSADERIEVTQNPSTNRSSVNVESTDLLAGLAD